MGGVGGLVYYDGFFLDIVARQTLEGSDSGQQFQADIVGGLPVGATHDYDATFDRSELDGLIGYEIARSDTTGTSAFVGFRYAKTSIDMETTTVGPIQNGVLILPFTQVFDGTLDTDVEYFGPYFGVSTWIRLKFLPGTIAINPAIAYLDGEITQSFTPDPGTRAPVAFEGTGRVDGTALGFNVGIEWTIPFQISEVSSLDLSIGFDRSQFEFDTDGDELVADFEETFNRVRARLSYTF